MNTVIRSFTLLVVFSLFCTTLYGQKYFYANYAPFDASIPSPEEFLGYPIGDQHTRYDLMVKYFELLAEKSDKAEISYYGKTYEHRPLVMLRISEPGHLNRLEEYREQRLRFIDPDQEESIAGVPLFVQLGYNVHGNEPSGGEAALLSAYTLVASQHPAIANYLKEAVVFIDPTINPDGRDRHTHWANMYKADPRVADPMDAEHNELWPRGRTNHYWFDLNRDWLLAVHPESKGKLSWYHQWYPNVVTDFHEMGTKSTYFFEPMKAIGSKDPIMPKENYTLLNDLFADYFSSTLDSIGSLYFTKEAFDGTYPGYGSSYPDLQGALALLFEQASSRGHVQETDFMDITFAFTIRNQYLCSFATLQAAVDNKALLYSYQNDFFKSAISNANRSSVKAYVFGDGHDANRTAEFLDFLKIHRIKVYENPQRIQAGGQSFESGKSFVVPTAQPQYRMIQSIFETYDEYRDSVYYDASAWSVVNFYNMPYAGQNRLPQLGKIVENANVSFVKPEKTNYAYLLDWNNYYAPAALYYLQSNGALVASAFKPFSIKASGEVRDFSYGTILIPVQQQKISSDSLFQLVKEASEKFSISLFTAHSGFSSSGVDLGSRYLQAIKKPEAILWIGEGSSSYEAGEVWHLLDTRVHMPITKARLDMFDRIDLERYNVMVMVSGSYPNLDSVRVAKINQWLSKGNTLVTSREASEWAIKNKLVKEELLSTEDDKEPGGPLPYVSAYENIGKRKVGGTIFQIELDLTHPLSFGYQRNKIPVYRNSNVWLKPSKSVYGTVARYSENPQVDGYISEKNLNDYLKPSASILVSKVGQGRVVLFAENHNFRGAWYGTNRLFLNALFLGSQIQVPE